MIKAEHSKIARLLFNPYIDRLLRKSFTNFYLVNKLPDIPVNKSLVITPNHISWWDGFFIDYVARKLIDKKLHLMMLETSLKKYWFFKKLGCFSITPENKRSVLATTKYTREILSDPNNFVITYPQGEIEPFEKRPLQIKEGLKLFLSENPNNITVLPFGFKIQFYNEKNPSVICRFGNAIENQSIINDFSSFENEFIKNLDVLNSAAFAKDFYKDIFK